METRKKEWAFWADVGWEVGRWGSVLSLFYLIRSLYFPWNVALFPWFLTWGNRGSITPHGPELKSDGVTGSYSSLSGSQTSFFPLLHSSSLQWEYTILGGLPLIANGRSNPWREGKRRCLCPDSSQPRFPTGQCAQRGASSSSLQGCMLTSCWQPPRMSVPTPGWKVSHPSLE